METFFNRQIRSGGKKGCSVSDLDKKRSYLKFTGEGIRRELCEISYEECSFYQLTMPDGYSGMICVGK